jgi:RNA polymerase sigma factor (sigma-70 family)
MSEEYKWVNGIVSENRRVIDKTLARLRDTCFSQVKTYVLRNKGSIEDAEDVFQEGLMVLYDNIMMDRFQGTSTVKTYLFAICRNKWLSILRKRKTIIPEDFAHIHEQKYLDIDSESIEKFMNNLSEGCKKVLYAYYFHGATMREITKQLKLKNEQIAKNKKYVCMKKLMDMVIEKQLDMNSFLKQ